MTGDHLLGDRCAGTGTRNGDGTGPGPMEIKREPHKQPLMGDDQEEAADWKDGGDPGGVKGPTPAADKGTNGGPR